MFGLLTGILYTFAKRSKRYVYLWIGVISALGRLLHSILVYAFMGIFFPEMGFHIGSAFDNWGTANDILTSALTTILVLGAYAFRQSSFFKQFEYRMFRKHSSQTRKTHFFGPILWIAGVTLVAAISIALYFVQRMSQVLSTSGYKLDDTANYDLMHLQVQFLLGILSLIFLVVLCLFLVYQYTVYLEQEAQTDTLTGIMNRSGFSSFCEHIIKELRFRGEEKGYFLVIDIDHFKSVNDTMGHLKGDEVLRKVAQHMQSIFGSWGVTGRMGGDEFVALLYTPLKQKDMEGLMNRFMDRVRQIAGAENTISCSIGITPFYQVSSLQTLYENADQCLYKAKNLGRDQYYIGETQGDFDES